MRSLSKNLNLFRKPVRDIFRIRQDFRSLSFGLFNMIVSCFWFRLTTFFK
ncbi:hypothetical protein LEP1GSC130_0261 [Leptospira santarosai str. 200403458]|nr:hypothetical protein LEP1GSC130_0261 [Leptospira santarosai str. 200403458]